MQQSVLGIRNKRYENSLDDRRAVMVIKNGHNLREFYIKNAKKITSLNTRKSLSLIGIIFFEFS